LGPSAWEGPGGRTMQRYYRERFEAQRDLARKLASTMEVNEILEKLREEARRLVPSAREACLLLLDPEAGKYTRPLQCALHERPVNCLACKRDRTAVRQALARRKGVVLSRSEPIRRPDGGLVRLGPEAALPIFCGEEILAVTSVVLKPGSRFRSRDFFLLEDLSEMAGNALLNAKKHWEATQEKIRLSQMLASLSPFVPRSVMSLVETSPELLEPQKEKKDVTVLFLDLEGYTRLFNRLSEAEVSDLIEQMFSGFIDPIHRSGGDINETAGDGLMIIFKNGDARTNAASAVRAALDIWERTCQVNAGLEAGQAPVVLNMGLSSGAALVGMTRFRGSLGTRMTFTASGLVTNLAARLADLASGGDILISQETRRLIEDLWPVWERGPVKLKGLDEPVRVFSILKAGGEAETVAQSAPVE